MTLFYARVLAGALTAVIVLGACTDRDDLAAGPEATVSVGESPPTGTVTPSASPSPGGDLISAENPFSEEDEVITIAVKEPATLDPMLVEDKGSVLLVRQLYEGLTRWDAASEEVEPAAAESWQVKDKGATFVFKLSEGATFHDGSPVTARDFVFAFDRIAQRKNASDLAYLLQRVKGFSDVNAVGNTKHLAGLKAPNDQTLIIELTEPDYEFPFVLTHPGLVPLPSEAVSQQDEFLTEPVGNGSFQMAQEWDVGGHIFLESFDGAIQAPAVDGLRFIPYPESAASWLDFLEGQVDVSEVPIGQIPDAAERFGRDGFVDSLNTYSYGLNLKVKSLGNKNLRQAISRAVDRETIAQVVYKGLMEEPRGIVPPGMRGFTKDACTKLCDFSPPEARRLLRKVPRKDRRVLLQYPDEPPHDQVADLLSRNFRAVGLRVKREALEFKDFFGVLQDDDQSVFRLTWIAEYPAADAYLGALFESDSPDNHTGFSSPAVDSLLRKARGTKSSKKRTKLYRKAEEKVLAQAPIAPIGYFRIFWAARPNVSGFEVDSTGTFDAATMDTAPEEEEEED
ncbi:MAG: ABC transporter substrate-binding protein [Actinomycetota bacterium]|nr:ABC transporter substrate-binding protein [Actinomycetota bacterium]